ncbi:MAG: response regulator, partial [Desulfobacterales bacterium]|nr:response regulator [Desulfobacterales bacterium]
MPILFQLMTLFLFTLLFPFPLELFANQPIIIHEGQGEYPIGLYMDILEDKDGKLTIDDILSPEFNGNWIPSKSKEPTYGFTNSAYWVRFFIETKFSQTKEWLLEQSYPLIDLIDLYIIKDHGTIITKYGGDSFPFSSREIQHRNIVFPISINASAHTLPVYLRFKSESSMQILLTLWSPTAFIQKVNNELFSLGLYYGILFAMLLYNLFIFFSLREKTFLFYVVFVLTYAAIQMTFNGLAFQYLWPNYVWWANKSTPFLMAFSFIWGLLFTQRFLNTRLNTPFLNKISVVLLAMCCFVTIASLIVPYRYAIKMAIFLTALFDVVLLLAGGMCWFKGFRPARYFMLAWTFFLCGMIANVFEVIGLIPGVFIARYGIQIGSAMEMILLSFALADRINIMKKEAFDSQQKALENERLFRQAQEKVLVAQNLAVENLKKADKLKDEFLSNTSHELRTPLNGIIGLAESLIDGSSGSLSDNARHNLFMIVSSGKRLANLVNDILDFSKLRNKDLELRQNPVDMRQLTEIILMLSQPLTSGKTIVLKNDIPSDIPYVLGDEDRLQQILYNLVGNAIKFTDKGEVRISARIQDDMLEISILDTGIGIPKKKHEDIFKSFEQADGSIERKYGGTGLGLAITKKLIDLQGGKIWVESEIGNGSTFRFTLPLTYEKPEVKKIEKRRVEIDEKEMDTEHDRRKMNMPVEIERRKELNDSREKLICVDLKGIKILAVDDDPINLQVIQNYLSISGTLVELVYSGMEALEKLDTIRPDLILLDIMMPRLNGYEVSKQIREKYSKEELPIIFISAKNQVPDIVDG